MFAKLLADSGGADQIVDTIVGRASGRMLPWAMAAVGAIIGLPMFFEIGLVLLMPVIYLVARRAQVSLITVGIPALAGLSAMHGFVPPHPGPVTAIDYLGADLGVTLALGLLVAIPTIIVAGPLFGTIAGRWVVVEAPDTFDERRPGAASTTSTAPVVRGHHRDRPAAGRADARQGDRRHRHRRPGGQRPAGRRRDRQPVRRAADLGPGRDVHLRRRASGWTGRSSRTPSSASLPPIAGILLIVSAGGGFKQVLVDTGIGTLLADWASDANISVLLLAWVLAVLIRLATGSATVATITARSLMIGLVEGMSDRRDLAGRARRRRRLAVLLPRQRRRLLAGQGVLRDDRRSDHQDLVADGDRAVGDRAGRACCCCRCHLSIEVVDVAAARHQVDVVVDADPGRRWSSAG